MEYYISAKIIMKVIKQRVNCPQVMANEYSRIQMCTDVKLEMWEDWKTAQEIEVTWLKTVTIMEELRSSFVLLLDVITC